MFNLKVSAMMCIEFKCLQNGSHLYFGEQMELLRFLKFLLQSNEDFNPLDFYFDLDGSTYYLTIKQMNM